MDLGQYHRRDVHSLPTEFQYAGSPDSSTQTHRMLSFDGLPRAQPDQLLIAPTTLTNITSSSYSHIDPMSMTMPQHPLVWPGNQMSSGFEDPESNYYDYSTNVASNNEGVFLRNMNYEVPRWMPNEMNGNEYNDNHINLGSFTPSPYSINSNRSNQHLNPADLPYHSLEDHHDFARLSLSGSPLPKHEDDRGMEPPPFDHSPVVNRLPSSDASEEGFTSREMTAMDDGDQAAEEPYAKLIHRALMSAPNHAMILQEIYQWFRENTSKGSSESKGWMNSIRHNLSMNAAFKKSERKMLGDETKKSTEWVLEDFAVKEGVQSTTRYRKGTGAKKFTRSDHPALTRQKAGRLGGVSAARNSSKNHYRINTHINTNHTDNNNDNNNNNSHSQQHGGRTTIKDENTLFLRDRRAVISSTTAGMMMRGIDERRREDFHREMNRERTLQRRQRSPLTPPSGGGGVSMSAAGPGGSSPPPSQYFFHSKPMMVASSSAGLDHLGGYGGGGGDAVVGVGVDHFSLEDVQGVYALDDDDHAPLFGEPFCGNAVPSQRF